MIYLKSCVRCGGDVHVNSDLYGAFATCVQCGWTRDIGTDPLSALVAGTADSRRAPAVAQAPPAIGTVSA